ncbi:hypothetical protein Vadar_008124 [Vaccinium darrowii]|uniref:Uncharacterized protein n=1 Tax=Vaccinium darrowii TaxID=229202 RepID=A0ACB7Z3T1_9ERIC|nr:hypothetical protein Vadar_008124 [Vaccinium darrowii]
MSFYFVGTLVAVGLAFWLKVGFSGLWFGLLSAQAACAVSVLHVVLVRTDWEGEALRAKKLTGSGLKMISNNGSRRENVENGEERKGPPSQACPQGSHLLFRHASRAPASFLGVPLGLRPPSQACLSGSGLLLRRAPGTPASFSGVPPGLRPPSQACPQDPRLLLRRAPRAPASFSGMPLGPQPPSQACPQGSSLLLRRAPGILASSGAPLGPQPPSKACPQGSGLLLRRAPGTAASFSSVPPGLPPPS